MTLLVRDPMARERILAERRASEGDRYDEVWEGQYVMSPIAGDDHQRIVQRLATILDLVVGLTGRGEVRPGVNVSDRVVGWQENYRVPDVVVRSEGGAARILEAHWCGGPDFVVEVISPEDGAREKLPFYAAIGTREVMLIDRKPWALELYTLQDGRMVPVGVSRPGTGQVVASGVVPLTFKLVKEGERTLVEVAHTADGQTWRF